MIKAEAFETECPYCQCKTLVPAKMDDYEWKQDRYYSEQGLFFCIHCQGAMNIKAHRVILDIERC